MKDMEIVEPKRGDRLVLNGKETRIYEFDEDHGTHLEDGRWVCISKFEKKGGIWVEKGKPTRIFAIGERYSKATLAHPGVAVDRPAVFEGGNPERIVTSSPCCHLHARKLRLDDLLKNLEDGVGEICVHCKWWYKVTLLFRDSPRLGAYGVRWESRGGQ